MVSKDELKDKLEALEEGTAVALKVDVDAYFEVITTITDELIRGKDMNVIYTTTTIPATSIIGVLDALEIPRDRVHFVDAMSYMTMGGSGRSSDVTYVESPTMLENIMLKIEYLLRKHPAETHTVVLDSINSLAIHNDMKILAEFLHIMVSNLRSYNCFTLIMAVAEQQAEDVDNVLAMVCDEFMAVTS